jgi:hypothetical protein
LKSIWHKNCLIYSLSRGKEVGECYLNKKFLRYKKARREGGDSKGKGTKPFKGIIGKNLMGKI